MVTNNNKQTIISHDSKVGSLQWNSRRRLSLNFCLKSRMSHVV